MNLNDYQHEEEDNYQRDQSSCDVYLQSFKLLIHPMLGMSAIRFRSDKRIDVLASEIIILKEL